MFLPASQPPRGASTAPDLPDAAYLRRETSLHEPGDETRPSSVNDGSSPRRTWARTGLVALSGLAVTLLVWQILRDTESRALAAEVRLGAEVRARSVRHELDHVVDVLETISLLVEIPGAGTRAQFRSMTAPLLVRNDAILGLGWNPLVLASDRAAHEDAGRREGLPGYGIRELAPDRALVAAGARSEYIVAFYLEPTEGNAAALGLDVGAEPMRRAALVRARDTGERALAGPLSLVPSPEDTGFLLFQPRYRPGAPTSNSGERRTALLGYFVAVLRGDDLLAPALREFGESDIEMHVLEPSGPDGNRVIYTPDRTNLPENPAPADIIATRGARGALAQVSMLDFGGRRFTLIQIPTEQFLARHTSLAPLLALVGGGLLSALLALHQHALRRQAWRVDHLVGKLTSEIAQRRQAESALHEEKERLRITLDAIVDAAWDWNVATGTLFLSDSWRERFGYPPERRQSDIAFWSGLIHPDDRERVLALFQRCIDGETDDYTCEYRIRSASGDWRWSLDRGRVVLRDEGGRPLRMVGAESDITAQKIAEEERKRFGLQLQHTQKLESLGVLAGGIAHDFNNLLVAILGGADVALAALPDESPGRDEIAQIRIAATRAAELVREMLAYSGRGRVDLEPIDVSVLVEKMLHLLRASISKTARLEFAASSGLPLVRGDATQIRQIVINLITNASDALGGEDGVVRVRTGRFDKQCAAVDGVLRLEPEPPGDTVFVEVEDTGVGMDLDTQSRIFDPFFTTKFQGRGLGLAAVLGIVRSHGGAVRLRSAPGRGTTFTILLPGADARYAALPPAHMQSHREDWRQQGVVLVVDDEPYVRSVVSRILTGAGFEVLAAEDGHAALELFRVHADSVVAVLLDVTMPGMSGDVVLRELRRIREDVRVVMSSGYGADTDANGDFEHVAAFLPKPYRANALLEALRSALA